MDICCDDDYYTYPESLLMQKERTNRNYRREKEIYRGVRRRYIKNRRRVTPACLIM